jgi:hypothetical protein
VAALQPTAKPVAQGLRRDAIDRKRGTGGVFPVTRVPSNKQRAFRSYR